jgi:hypothetical protein
MASTKDPEPDQQNGEEKSEAMERKKKSNKKEKKLKRLKRMELASQGFSDEFKFSEAQDVEFYIDRTCFVSIFRLFSNLVFL